MVYFPKFYFSVTKKKSPVLTNFPSLIWYVRNKYFLNRIVASDKEYRAPKTVSRKKKNIDTPGLTPSSIIGTWLFIHFNSNIYEQLALSIIKSIAICEVTLSIAFLNDVLCNIYLCNKPKVNLINFTKKYNKVIKKVFIYAQRLKQRKSCKKYEDQFKSALK